MAAKNEKRQFIKIRGANEHNLKNIDLDIPRNELVVLTGLSGSGKSFNTLHIRFLHLSQELSCIRRQRLHISPLSFRIGSFESFKPIINK